ncbi:hypothetical protein HBH71_057780 [Parastagonospora nodorum]|nr:hypothetical protein HBH71_057780 [Parastagonospora nodorum]KAH6364639.1 hypothetical protein HBI34_163330 [Parastagonospora nodorum]
MNNMRTLTFAAVAAAAASEAIQYGAPIDQVWAPAMAARDDCAALPALCTGPAMVSGTATTLTYVCPKTVEAATTLVVTVTTTVTEAPASSAPIAAPGPVTAVSASSVPAPVPAPTTPGGPDQPVSTSEEATTTTTVHSTTKLTKTIIVSHKTSSSSLISAVPITTDPATTDAESSLSWSTSAIPTTTDSATTPVGSVSSTDLPVPPFSTLSKNATISVSPIPVSTANSSWVLPTAPITLSIWPTPSASATPSPCVGCFPSNSMIESSAVVATSNVTTLTTMDAAPFSTSTESITATAESQSPIFKNTTSTSGYAMPSVLRIRHDPSSTAAASSSAAASLSSASSASSAASSSNEASSSSAAASSSAASSASEASSSIAASSTSTAAEPTKTGSAALQSVPLAMLVFGLAIAAYCA